MSEFILNNLEHKDGDQYIVGHKFGADHPNTHWVANPRARKFNTSTTENESKAFIYTDSKKAFQHIHKKITKWNNPESDYIFCAVIKNLRTGKEGFWTI
jgi:hypothetical protein|tara:strand:- start:6486 stop:6782 length:297 start_codon:yes stop_codon:yes gene_type:complete